jgi:SOS-response transcriptional repressor LexA
MNFGYILQNELTLPQALSENALMVHTSEEERLAEFAKRLGEALEFAKINKYGSGILLARLTGKTGKAGNKWVNGESFPRKGNMEMIADRLGVRVEWLEYGVGPMKTDGNVEIDATHRTRRRAPVISDIQAGQWADCNDSLPLGMGDSWEDVPDNTSPNAFWLRVTGDSMTSLAGTSVPNGSLILVNPDTSADSGRLVVAKLTDSEQVTFKKLVIDGGRKYLKPLNPAYPVIEITANCRIVGVVTDAKQKL